MAQQRQKLAKFRSYWKGLLPEEKDVLAERVGVGKLHLSHVVYGHVRPGAKIAVAIEAATKGYITAHYLRPDIFKK